MQPSLRGVLRGTGARVPSSQQRWTLRRGPVPGPYPAAIQQRSRLYVAVAATEVATPQQELKSPTVVLRLPYRVEFGEELRLVGSGPKLGDWTPENAMRLTWSEGDVWVAEVPLEAGHYEFKCIVYNVNTNAVTRWEDGGNRMLDVKPELGKWEVDCSWGATADMVQAFTPAPAPVVVAPPEPTPEELAAAAAAEALAAATAAAAEAEQAAASSNGNGEVAAESANGTHAQLDDLAASASPSGAAAAAAALNGNGVYGSAAAASEGRSGEAGAAQEAGGVNVGGVLLTLVGALAGVALAVALYAPTPESRQAIASLRSTASQTLSTTMQQSGLAGAQVRSTVQSQMSAIQGQVAVLQGTLSAAGEQVAALQPVVKQQVASLQESVADSISSLQDGVDALQDGVNTLQRSGAASAAFVTSSAQALTAAAADSLSDAVSAVPVGEVVQSSGSVLQVRG